MNERGYILPFCLFFLSLISMLTLTLMTHNHWQQRLTSLFITHQQKQTAVYFAVSAFFKQKKDFSKEACTLDWQASETVWQSLATGDAYCIVQQAKVTIRYIVLLPQSLKEPQSIAVIAHADPQADWQNFLIYV